MAKKVKSKKVKRFLVDILDMGKPRLMFRCKTKSAAARVKRVNKAWLAAGNFPGPNTLEDLAEVANKSPGKTVEQIFKLYRGW